MFLNAVLGDVPVLGAPAAVSYNPTTIFDWFCLESYAEKGLIWKISLISVTGDYVLTALNVLIPSVRLENKI
jgi:hypothetical protein